jgi:hypothetical protein
MGNDAILTVIKYPVTGHVTKRMILTQTSLTQRTSEPRPNDQSPNAYC